MMRTNGARGVRAALAVTVVAGLFTIAPLAQAGDAGAMLPAPAAVDGGAAPPNGVTTMAAVGTAFTYQGRLRSTGSPANGPFDFSFRLMDAAAGGVQIGSTIDLDDVAVSDGLFTVPLDFGSGAFGGGARWLEISVRPGAGGAYTLLSPRQQLNAAPYALAMPNVYTSEAAGFVGVGRDFQISFNEKFGVRALTGPNTYGGMYVETSDAAGWPFYGYGTNGSYRAWTYLDGAVGEWRLYNGGTSLTVPNGGGLRIENTLNADGLRINDTGDDGIQIGSGTDYPNYGVYVPSPGVSVYALWPNTSAASGNYALYTVDNIEAGVVTMAAQMIVAQVDGAEALEHGDVVAAVGVADPYEGGTNRLALVRLVGADATGVVGVVATRMAWQAAPGKEAEGEKVLAPAEGKASGGDYVALVIAGVTDVRVAPGAGITKGTRLTADGGGVRALRVESLNGMPVSEGAPVVGVALADAAGRDTVPVLVNVR